jgi:hypothetical protein
MHAVLRVSSRPLARERVSCWGRPWAGPHHAVRRAWRGTRARAQHGSRWGARTRGRAGPRSSAQGWIWSGHLHWSCGQWAPAGKKSWSVWTWAIGWAGRGQQVRTHNCVRIVPPTVNRGLAPNLFLYSFGLICVSTLSELDSQLIFPIITWSQEVWTHHS